MFESKIYFYFLNWEISKNIKNLFNLWAEKMKIS